MRRANEVLLQGHIEEFMEEAKGHIEESKIIFLHAPGLNKNLFLSESRPLAAQAHKIKAVNVPNVKAQYQDAVELVSKLIQVKWTLNQ